MNIPKKRINFVGKTLSFHIRIHIRIILET